GSYARTRSDTTKHMQSVSIGLLLLVQHDYSHDLSSWQLLSTRHSLSQRIFVSEWHIQCEDRITECVGMHSLHTWLLLRLYRAIGTNGQLFGRILLWWWQFSGSTI